ncbi:Cell division cycle-associated protein 8 [Nesidiocoris tenuis]|uniref:Cell division cycle-associated protein 8 n=1 Tax=Nesidiocoris tenuis TaxID=355587 RepID=A0ABN7BA93_9HEMI|nr:Cell division cycle-associated protein 8 [Nesidiocoris tenuis]
MACSSPSEKTETDDEFYRNLLRLKETFVRQAENEKDAIEIMIDNNFNKTIATLQKNNYLTNAIVTPGMFSKNESLLEGIKNIIEDRKKRGTITVSDSTSGISSDASRRRRSHSESRDTFTDAVRNATQKKPRSSSCDRLNRFMTPLRQRDDSSSMKIANVTPLVRNGVNRSNILRKPMPGETAISLTGSPLLVTCDNVIAPSLTVPLRDGRVLNLQRGATADEFRLPSNMDKDVIESLRDIQNYLNKALP